MSKKGSLIGILLLVAFGMLGVSSFLRSLSPYVSFEEARITGQRVQVYGRIDRTRPMGSDAERGLFSFYLEDENHDSLRVVYGGVKPGNFDQADGVVAIGTYREGAFHADRLLVKCPSKEEEQRLRERYRQTAGQGRR
ncbi:MAG TPA: cytochrome c maturation protein CcmE [Armatimonadetes bacterium]|nr:cytochrome c maturation protein CcmE [Armatimonadota bacterium]